MKRKAGETPRNQLDTLKTPSGLPGKIPRPESIGTKSPWGKDKNSVSDKSLDIGGSSRSLVGSGGGEGDGPKATSEEKER